MLPPSRILPEAFAMLMLLASTTWTGTATGASWSDTESDADEAVARLREEVLGARWLLGQASAILVFPRVSRAPFGLGRERGRGVLQVRGRVTDHYRIVCGERGPCVPARPRAVFVALLDDAVLAGFRARPTWRAGVDGALSEARAEASGLLYPGALTGPVVGMVLGAGGLIADGRLTGARFTRIES